MALLKIRCPECNAPLKSPTGFTVGEAVSCPKCETEFTVKEPEEEPEGDADEGEDAPKNKKAAYDEDEKPVRRAYKDSPLRYAVLGVLVVIMLVLAYMLYLKKKKEREQDDAQRHSVPVLAEHLRPQEPTARAGHTRPFIPQPGVVVSPSKLTRPALACLFALGVLALGACAQKAEQKAEDTNPPPLPPPVPKGAPKPKPADKSGKGTGAFDPLSGWMGAAPAPGSPAEQALLQKYRTALVGTWAADLGNGTAEDLTYNADGTFLAKLTGPAPASASGKYAVLGLVGTKGLKVRLDSGSAPRTVTVTFDGDELQHPTLQPGVTGTFRKK